jgi:hypothetical protein
VTKSPPSKSAAVNVAVPNERFLQAAVGERVDVASFGHELFIDDLELNFTSASPVTLLVGGELLFLGFRR